MKKMHEWLKSQWDLLSKSFRRVCSQREVIFLIFVIILISYISISSLKTVNVELHSILKLEEPVLVYSAGLYRTGSTVMFNIIRIWISLVDPNYISWFAINEKVLSGAQKQGFSIVNKIHMPWMARPQNYNKNSTVNPTIIFLSHRRVEDQMCSMLLMNIQVPDGIRSLSKTCKVQKQWQDQFYKNAKEDGVKLVDMNFDDWIRDPRGTVHAIGIELGIQGINDMWVDLVHEQVSNIKSPKDWILDWPRNLHPLTNMLPHHVHTEEDRSEACSGVKDMIVECGWDGSPEDKTKILKV